MRPPTENRKQPHITSFLSHASVQKPASSRAGATRAARRIRVEGSLDRREQAVSCRLAYCWMRREERRIRRYGSDTSSAKADYSMMDTVTVYAASWRRGRPRRGVDPVDL